MANVRANASAKWKRRTASAGQEYTEGVQSPRRGWQQSTVAAAAAQAAGVQQAISEKRFEKGVAKAGDQAWSNGALTKGVARFGQGVELAEDKYAQNVAPYTQTIQSLNLPPRGPKGDPRNLERVRIVAQALRAKKLGRAS